MSVDVTLRPATRADAALLHAWVNDPDVRRWSFRGEPITWEEHLAWLDRVLADDARALAVAEREGRPVGQVRLDREDDTLVISVSVAPEARGSGLGVAIISAACAAADRTVVARIKPANAGSIRSFERAGFQERRRSSSMVELVRPPAPPPA